MRTTVIVILFLLNSSAFSQQYKICMNRFRSFHSVDLEQYTVGWDYSILLSDQYSEFRLGYISDNYRRIRIKLLSVIKNCDKPSQYFIHGKTNVNGNICDFQGTINITQVLLVDEPYLGVDDIYADSSISSQGMIVAEYEFFEDPSQSHVGVFRGELISNWYIIGNHELRYDNIEIYSDNWCNNQFIGQWQSYNSNESKVCVWGHERLFDPQNKLDIGAGLFSPAPEYRSEGWESYIRLLDDSDTEAFLHENAKWWKE